MNYAHFIFTRYNLGLYENPKIQDKEAWMEERFELFKGCSDSIHNQTTNNFIWIIGIDPKTPEEEKKRIQSYGTIDTVITNREIADFVRTNVAPFINKEWIVTQRLDNDDRLEDRCVEEIQSQLREVEEVIDIDGRQLDLNTGKYYTSGRKRPNSPFLTLCERNDGEVKTCFFRAHSNMGETFKARKIEKQLYIQVIHEGCLMNKLIGTEIE